ncbi:MAG: hypothetical protein R3264_16925, partial [Anaerolineae bacterium]|nr:hypothetical protein [Anaerolineae bacterium]
METRFESKEEISNFIATLNVIGNVIALPIQLFFLNRIIEGVGLGNTSLIFPSATLAISGTLIFFRTIPAAALGYLNGSVVRTTFRNPIDNLLYNAVPLRIKGRARAFIVGLVVPVGALVGGLLLLTPTISNADSVLRFILMGLFAVALLGTAFVIRRQYGHALINMLEEEDFSFLLAQMGEARTVADPATL